MRGYHVAGRFLRKIGLRIHARPARFTSPDGVVSFTFDDFPKSALSAGGGILEQCGTRGTYYVSMDLAGIDRVVGPMFDHEDIRAAHRAGHEIACHTHTHLDCGASGTRSILTSLCDNAVALSSVIEGFLPTNFAYPYGRVSPMAKRVLGRRFSSCRGIREGINHGTIDLADLMTVSLYDSHFDETEVRRLIEYNRSVAGWLIFYTHDVVDTPSPFGCRPRQLAAVVAYAARHTTILPVRDAVTRARPITAIARTVYKAIPERIGEA